MNHRKAEVTLEKERKKEEAQAKKAANEIRARASRVIIMLTPISFALEELVAQPTFKRMTKNMQKELLNAKSKSASLIEEAESKCKAKDPQALTISQDELREFAKEAGKIIENGWKTVLAKA